MKAWVILAITVITAGSALAAPAYPRSVLLEADPTAAELEALRGFREQKGDVDMPLAASSIAAGHADLNGDGRNDLLFRVHDIVHCGSHGCDTHAVLATPKGYAPEVIDLATSGGAVTLLASRHKGMRDLRFGDTSYIFRWDGAAYK